MKRGARRASDCRLAKSVSAAYPDISLEIISSGDTGGGLVATQWLLHGTPHRPANGRYAAYRSHRRLSGASFAQVEGDKIRSEHVYIDRQTVAEQLGLKAE